MTPDRYVHEVNKIALANHWRQGRTSNLRT